MHRFRWVFLAVLIAAAAVSPSVALAANPEPVTTATISGVENADGTYVDGVVVKLSAALEWPDDAPRPSVATEYRLDNGEWVPDTCVWISEEGTHTVSYRSRYDALYPRIEVVEHAKSIVIAVRSPRPVTTARVYQGLEIDDGSYVGGVDLELGATLEWPDGAPRPALTTEYKLDDGEWVTGTSVRMATKGTHTVSYRSRYCPSWTPVEVVEQARSKTLTISSPVPNSTATVYGRGYGDGTYIGSVYIGLVATLDWPDGSPPALTTEYSLDGGKTWTAALGVEITADGVTEILYRSHYIWWSVSGQVVEPAKSIAVTVHNPRAVTNAAVSGQAGRNGWYTSPVTVMLSASAADRVPVEWIDYTLDGSTWTTYTAPFAIQTEGTTTVTFRSTTPFGGVEDAQSIVVRIDTSAPTLEPITPSEGLTLVLGADVLAGWRATETVSGLADEWRSLEGGSPLDTASVGSKTLVFGACDVAGNEAWAAVNYRVVYEWGGFGPATGTDAPSVFDVGTTVPVRFAIRDAAGRPAEAARATLSMLKLSDTVSASPWVPVFSGAPTGGGAFAHDPATGMYGFNLDTTLVRPGTYRVTATLDDGTSHSTRICVR